MVKGNGDGLEFWLEQAITALNSALKARMNPGPRARITESADSCFLLHALISPRNDQ
jgi:hypothetical protein